MALQQILFYAGIVFIVLAIGLAAFTVFYFKKFQVQDAMDELSGKKRNESIENMKSSPKKYSTGVLRQKQAAPAAPIASAQSVSQVPVVQDPEVKGAHAKKKEAVKLVPLNQADDSSTSVLGAEAELDEAKNAAVEAADDSSTMVLGEDQPAADDGATIVLGDDQPAADDGATEVLGEDQPAADDGATEVLGEDQPAADDGATVVLGDEPEEASTPAEEASDENVHAFEDDETATTVLDVAEQAADDDSATVILESDDAATTILESDDAATTILDSDDAATTILAEDDSATEVLASDDAPTEVFVDDDSATVILDQDDDEATTLLSDEAVKAESEDIEGNEEDGEGTDEAPVTDFVIVKKLVLTESTSVVQASEE